MTNPISAMLGKINPALGTATQFLGVLRTAKDPLAALYKMAETNQQAKQMTDFIDQNGGLQQAVTARAKMDGVDPNEAIQQALQFLK